MTAPSRRVILKLLAVASFLVALFFAISPYLRGAAFVVDAAGFQGVIRTLVDWQHDGVREENTTVDTRYGGVRGRLYLPDTAVRRTVVLTPGVHLKGIDEPRLVGFARTLAAHRLAVLTPELEDLTHYRITAAATNTIEDAGRWVATNRSLAPDGRVGFMGISFAGGLSVVAAARPDLRDRTAFVLSLGGHGDLTRVLRYLCTGSLPDGSHRPPHDYGVAVILLNLVNELAPPGQAEILRDGVETFLRGSTFDMIDKPAAEREFARARSLEASLEPETAELLRAVNEREVATLGKRLLPYVEAFADAATLSPEHSAAPTAPVFLLHGTDDNVIPSIESSLLAQYLSGKTSVYLEITPLITHAEVDRRAGLSDALRLVGFWSSVLRQ